MTEIGYTISDRVKANKNKADEVIDELEQIDGVSAHQVTTDEFDIPPTAIIKVAVDLETLRDD